MKKNVMMRVASIMLVLVLMSSSVISGTFAKYVTSGSSSDNARVAKWGVTVEADFSELFSQRYDTKATWDGDTDGDSVVSSEVDVDVVAPGTSGTLAKFAVKGQPEVDVAVTYEADFEIGDNWMVDADNNNVNSGASYVRDTFYCPIIITINGESFNGLKYANAAEFETLIEAKIAEKAAKKYNAGTGLQDVVYDDLNVTWAWAFDSSSEGGIGYNNDEYDTQLGDAAVYLTAATLSLEVKCTVTQID